MRGRTLGDFDVVHDLRASEQVAVGRVAIHNEAAQWETWTRFVARSFKGRPPPSPEEDILSYNIDASLDASLSMHCVTRMRVRVRGPNSGDVLPFELDTAMHAISAKVDGAPAEIYQHDSRHAWPGMQELRQRASGLSPRRIRWSPVPSMISRLFTTVKLFYQTPAVISIPSAREARGIPAAGAQFATYDVTYHYPRTLDLISAGKVMEDHTEDGIRTTHRVPQGKLRLLGVNLGQYAARETVSNGITLEGFRQS